MCLDLLLGMEVRCPQYRKHAQAQVQPRNDEEQQRVADVRNMLRRAVIPRGVSIVLDVQRLRCTDLGCG